MVVGLLDGGLVACFEAGLELIESVDELESEPKVLWAGHGYLRKGTKKSTISTQKTALAAALTPGAAGHQGGDGGPCGVPASSGGVGTRHQSKPDSPLPCGCWESVQRSLLFVANRFNITRPTNKGGAKHTPGGLATSHPRATAIQAVADFTSVAHDS